jgi:ligand-binding sensor domain-containing protein/serine phosphatase RsbU (regulator of sigma subunit)
MQDSHGNVWVATGGGLCKFDGVAFERYTTRDGLAHPRLFCLAEDQQQNIWIGSTKGLNVYHNDSIYTLVDTAVGIDIKALARSADGSMWLMTDKGLHNVTFGNGQFSSTAVHFDFGPDQRAAILQDRVLNTFLAETATGHLFVGLNNAVYRFRGDTLRQLATSPGLDVYSACMLENDDVIFGTSKGLYGYDNESLIPIDNVHLNDIDIRKMVRSEDQLWVLGKRTFDSDDTQLLLSISLTDPSYYREIGAKNGLIKDPKSLFIDHEKNVWTGAYGGLSVLKGESFVNYEASTGLVGDKAWGIHQGMDGAVWVGTIGQGLSIIKGKDIRTFTVSDGLPDLYVGAIHQLSPTRTLIGTARKGLCEAIYDPSTDSYTFSQLDNAMNEQKVRVDHIVEDRSGTIWVGTSKGLYTSSNGTDFEHLPIFDGDTTQVTIHRILLASDGNTWIGTKFHGLYLYKGTGFEPSGEEGLQNITISSVCEDADHHIWISTIDDGIARVSDGKFNWISEQDGLTSNVIYILQADKRGNVWVGSNLGLDKLDAAKFNASGEIDIRHYDTNDGLQALEMNLNGSIEDSNGDLWFSTNNGVLKYDYKYDLSNRTPPNTSLLDLKLHSKEVDWTAYADSMMLGVNLPIHPVLPHNQNHLTFEFVGISYKNPKAIKYSWILEGFDKAEVPASASRQIIYSNLPPGDYVFKLKAANNDGVWNEEAVEFPFTILPPFWATWWFRILVALCSVGLVYGLYRWRTQALINRQKELEGTVEVRTQEIRLQKEIVEDKNREIIDSINYARRLQKAILPPVQRIEEHLPESFILFKPKDVVSGDFYWFSNVNGISFIAAADCTGHGVPGAMVSVVCSNALNRVVKEFGVTEPAKILDKTRELVIETFAQSNEDVKDGMDISLCAIDSAANTLQYAGANNSLYLVRDSKLFNSETDFDSGVPVLRTSGSNLTPSEVQAAMAAGTSIIHSQESEHTLVEVKANKQHIGKHVKVEHPFTNHKISLKKGDRFYLFTDGFADQFGGPNGKKFMYKPFRQLLLKYLNTPMSQQGKLFDQEFERWRGDLEQVDDVCVIGLRI